MNSVKCILDVAWLQTSESPFTLIQYVWCCAHWPLFPQLEKQSTNQSLVGGIKKLAS